MLLSDCPPNVLSDDSSALRDLELALNLKMATMDIGSDSLSTAFTMSCSFSLAGNRVFDFPPLMLILLLTLPMPTMYIDAPALVLTTTRCFSNRVVCPAGSRWNTSPMNSGSAVCAFAVQAKNAIIAARMKLLSVIRFMSLWFGVSGRPVNKLGSTDKDCF